MNSSSNLYGSTAVAEAAFSNAFTAGLEACSTVPAIAVAEVRY